MPFQYQDPLHVLLDYIAKVSTADLCYIFTLRDYINSNVGGDVAGARMRCGPRSRRRLETNSGIRR
jgi:hypothetical protein